MLKKLRERVKEEFHQFLHPKTHPIWGRFDLDETEIDRLRTEIFVLKEKLSRWNTRIYFTDIADLSDTLIRAKDAHAKFERGLAKPDSNWPLWYASYIAMEQGLAISSSLIPKPRCVGTSCVAPQIDSPEEKLSESLDTIDMSKEEEDYWKAH